MDVLQLIKNEFPAFQTQALIADAIAFVEQESVFHIIVVDEQANFCGVLHQDALYNSENDALPIASLSHFFIPGMLNQNEHILNAFGLFANMRLTVLAVVDEKQQYLGYLMAKDLVYELGRLPAMQKYGGIVVLEMEAQDYQISQISQILESDDARILALYVNELPGTFSKIAVTIKTNKQDLSRALQTFDRYGYDVAATYHHSELGLDLKDRYESFMKYLEI
jgi:Mg/Co/Ni transporter MgtE